MNKEERVKLQQKAAQAEQETRSFFKKFHKKKSFNFNHVLYDLHEEAFARFDCLKCANCCRSISPIIHEKDIDRISRHLKMKPSKVTEKYFQKDEEGDFVFRSTPCPFLLPDNYCSIYEVRPKSCREYPHTHQKEFITNYHLTIKNTYVCPIACYVVEKLKEKFATYLSNKG